MKTIYFFLSFLFFFSSFAQTSEYKKLTDEGLELLKQENLIDAFAKYQQALKIDSSKVEVNYGMGVTYLYLYEKQKTNCDNALYYINKAIKIDDNYRSCYFNRGKIRAYLNEYRDAITDFDRAIKKDSIDANSYFCRAMVKIKLSENTGACEDFYKSAKLGFKPAYEIFQNNCRIKK